MTSPASEQKEPNGDALDDAAEQPHGEEQPTLAKKRRKGKAPGPEVVLADGGEPQVRTWRVCSENKVNVRKGIAHDSERLRHMPAGEEFEAEGPYKLTKRGERFQWLKLTGEDAGWVCTRSSKDANKVVATLKRKQSTDPQQAPVQAKIEYALLIKPEWCKQIFEKGKVWEIRGGPCNRRGRFAVGASGTGTLVGEATMINCLKVGKLCPETGELKPWSKKHKKLFIKRGEHYKKHRIADLDIVQYPKVYAWVFDDVVRYKTPLPYKHRQGAIKWIRLDESTMAEAVEDSDVGYRSSSSEKSSSSSSNSSSSSSESSAEDDPAAKMAPWAKEKA